MLHNKSRMKSQSLGDPSLIFHQIAGKKARRYC